MSVRMGAVIVAGVVSMAALSACMGASWTFQQHTTCDNDVYSAPAWVGTRIYYAVANQSGQFVRVMDSSGGNYGVIADDAADPSPSPDPAGPGEAGSPGTGGRWLLYQSGEPFLTGGPPEYHLLDLESKQERIVGDLGTSPSWSPDGKWIAYRESSGGPIRKMDAVSGQSVALTNPSAGKVLLGEVFALWSPDGQSIAFIGGENGSQALYVMDADGGNVRQLIGQDDPACNVANHYPTITPRGWAPSGERLIFTRVCDTAYSLHMVGLDGVEGPQLGYLARSPIRVDWSPDGKQVLIGEDSTVYIANADSSDLRVLSKNGSDPRWSPDGQRIVLVGIDWARKVSEIYSMAPDGSDVKQLTNNPGANSVCVH